MAEGFEPDPKRRRFDDPRKVRFEEEAKFAEPMAPDETFAEYLDRPDVGGLLDETRPVESAGGRAPRVKYTEDEDELEWWPEQEWPEYEKFVRDDRERIEKAEEEACEVQKCRF